MDSMYLDGSQQVQSAGRTISNAADHMEQVARNLEGTFERQQRFMDDWLQRFEQILEKHSPQK